jgi:GntR family transcriptional repressor for pyruvate dehydrogenase complex
MIEKPVAALKRKTLAQHAAENLIEYVDDVRLEPGSYLPSEAELARQLSISRPVVREALRLLEATGVVQVVNGRGAMIRAPSSDVLTGFFERATKLRPEAIVETLELRSGNEMLSAALAAQRRTDEDLVRLQSISSAMRDDLASPRRFGEHDVALHLAIARASQNTMLFHVIESLRSAMERSIEERLERPETQSLIEHTQQLHEDIVEAIAQRNPDLAREAMERHFQEGVLLLLGIDSDEPRRSYSSRDVGISNAPRES